jgi:hypothetical protein
MILAVLAGLLAPTVPAAEQARLLKLLPAAAEVGGTAAGRPRFYSSDLFQYLNGGAEAFHNYDLVAMVHQEYRVRSAEITVDTFDLGTGLNAFGVYSAERSPEYRFVSIGAEGHLSESTLNFFQGAFYVKLSAFSERENAAPVLESLGRAISGRIGADRSLPGFLAWFPEQRLIARSQKYIKRAPLGHGFLAPAYLASYRWEGKEAVLVLSQAPDQAEARQRLELLRNHFRESGKVLLAPRDGPGLYRGVNRLEGEWLFVVHGRYLVILTNPPAQPGAFLKDVLAKAPKYRDSQLR